jgi:hypothetical protein
MVEHAENKCETCTKKHVGPQYGPETGCQVLTYRIGERGGCWAWSDDPEWEEKVELAIRIKYGEKGHKAVCQRGFRDKQRRRAG